MPDPSSDSTALAVTWDDVLRPGDVEPGQARLDPFSGAFPAIYSGTEFSLANAYLLSGLSLLVYRRFSEGKDEESGPAYCGRLAVLKRLGLTESYCGKIAGTTCTILEPDGSSSATPGPMVVFRGTAHLKNWLTNLQSIPSGWPGGGHVHGGFAAAHEELWDHLGPRVCSLIQERRPIFITGHSLGGALAALALSQIRQEHGSDAPACAYTFGSPRVGNGLFAGALVGAPLYRFVNNEDLVTRLPLPFALSKRLSFRHAGEAYFFDADARLQPRGHGDLPEESIGLTRIKSLVRHLSEAFQAKRPPAFLADHAPSVYHSRIQQALSDLNPR